MKKVILLATLLILGIRLQGQTDNFTYFNKVFEADTMNLLAQAVRPIEDGFLVFGGYSSIVNNALFVMKLDLEGNKVWMKHLDEGEEVGVLEDGKFISATPDGNYVVAYPTRKPNNYGEMNLLKFDKWGTVLWKRTYTDESSKFARHVISTSDNGFIMAGGQAHPTEGGDR